MTNSFFLLQKLNFDLEYEGKCFLPPKLDHKAKILMLSTNVKISVAGLEWLVGL